MRRILYSLTAIAAVLALPSMAAAAPVSCGPGTGDNIYTLDGTGDTTVVDCVFENGGGNLNGKLTEPNSDDFLNGPDDDITTDDQYFGGDWTSFCTNDPESGDTCGEVYDFDFSGGFGGTSGSWSFTGVAGEEYALGVKDGSDPFWAVFLLSSTSNSFSGTWEIEGGGLSHFVIYDREVETTTTPSSTEATPTSTTPSGVAPEPTLLTLLGGGLVMAARRLRRRKA